MKGTIFSIEEFAINDGPGIRTAVFLKGCPLRCVWCHNPEGISPAPQYVEKHTGRELCGYTIEASELATKLLKNKVIYEMGEGGITLSGGEPMFQHEFATELLSLTSSLHRVIETSGYTTQDIFKKVIALTDLVLLDIKHTDSQTHKKYTGVDNKPIIKNLEYLCSADKEFIIRIPLIPEVNDTENNMKTLASIIKGAKSLQRVEILPYNTLAGAKHYMLGLEYNPPFNTTKVPRVMADIFNDKNIKTIIL